MTHSQWILCSSKRTKTIPQGDFIVTQKDTSRRHDDSQSYICLHSVSAVISPAFSAPVRSGLPEAEWDSGLDWERACRRLLFESWQRDDRKAGGRRERKKDLLKYYIGFAIKNEKSLRRWEGGTDSNNESFRTWALSSDRQWGFREMDSSWIKSKKLQREGQWLSGLGSAPTNSLRCWLCRNSVLKEPSSLETIIWCIWGKI